MSTVQIGLDVGNVDHVLPVGVFFQCHGILTLSRTVIKGHLLVHVDLWHSKTLGPQSSIYICAVWSSLRPQENNRSLPGSSINRQSPKQAINIPSSTSPWLADHSVYAKVKGGSLVALSVSACRDLGMFSCPVLVWDQDTGLLCSCRACWSSVAKLMSFWKQLIKGSRCGRWAISLTDDAGCPLPGLAGGPWSTTQQPTLCLVDKWTISAVLIFVLLDFLATLAVWLWGWQSQSVCPPLCSRLKYLNNYWSDCIQFLCRHSWSPEDEVYWLWWSPDFSSGVTMRLTFLVFGEMPRQLSDGSPWHFGTDVHVPQRMNPNYFGDPLTSSSTTSRSKVSSLQQNISTFTRWTSTKFDKDILDPQRMNTIDFGDPNFSSSATMR